MRAAWLARFGRWIAGLSVSHSEGDGGYRKDGREGELDSSLRGFYPYAGGIVRLNRLEQGNKLS